jgi:hypothetical protein
VANEWKSAVVNQSREDLDRQQPTDVQLGTLYKRSAAGKLYSKIKALDDGMPVSHRRKRDACSLSLTFHDKYLCMSVTV